MRCGNRFGALGEHEHATVAEVRACYGQSQTSDQAAEEPLSREQVFGKAAEHTEPPMAREKQLSFLSDLRVERGMDPLPPDTKMYRSIAGAQIAELLLLPPAEVKTPATVDYPSVSAGHYAITAPANSGRDYDFYRVDKPTEGQWAGRTFLKMVVGGKPDFKIRDRNRISEVLAAIAKNPDEAAWRYGQEIGQCDKCNRSLTDHVSRAYSRGPECRAKYGTGFRGKVAAVLPGFDPGVRRNRPKPPVPNPARPRVMVG